MVTETSVVCMMAAAMPQSPERALQATARLCAAAMDGDLAKVGKQLDKGAHPDGEEDSLLAPLMLAVLLQPPVW